MSQDIQFINEAITVEFDRPPRFQRRPPCPQRFMWRGQIHHIQTLLREWRRDDFPRLKKVKRLGVAQIYFRVQVENGRVFDLCFDPIKNKGSWFLSKTVS